VLAGLLFVVLAAASWGTTGSVSTILAQRHGTDPLLIGAARMAVAAGALLIAARVGGASLVIARADLGRCLLMGACMAVYQATYFTAVGMTGIAVTALLAICSAPLMIAALATVMLGERLSVRVAVALGLGVTGTALLAAAPAGLAPGPRLVGGALLALSAGFAYALYVVIAKVSLVRSAPLPLTAVTFAVAAVLTLPVLAWTPAPLEQLARGWPWFLYLGGVATAGAYAVYAVGLRRVPAAVAGIATLVEPLTATALGVVVFDEPLGLTGAVGALTLLGAIALLIMKLEGASAVAPQT
jgi:DME family drug/metabolite transporter